MAVTRLERKGRKNKNVAKKRVATIKRLSAAPAIKNVDIEAIKEEFAKQGKKKPAVKSEEVQTEGTEITKKETTER